MSRSRIHPLPIVLAALALPACLEHAPESEGAMCEVDSDCDQGAGQVCDQGICWGDPPDPSQFAAILVPPAERPDLVPTELQSISIADDGTIGGLGFTDSVAISGRVVLACDDPESPQCGAAISARITAQRVSSIPGGPVYSRTVVSSAQVEGEAHPFVLRLPKDGAEYRVTVTEDVSEGQTATAPPMSLTVTADGDREVEWVLGDPEQLKTITGCIENKLGNGASYSGMVVTALGRWSPLSALERASAVAIANESGCFTLRVPINMLDEFDIVAKPAPETTAPSIRIVGEFVRDPLPAEEGVHQLAPLVMPSTANPVTFRLPVRGMNGAGGLSPVIAATVHFETEFDPGAEETRDVRISFATQATTSDSFDAEPGTATLQLYPGTVDENREYTVRVVPPAESEFQSAFTLNVAVGTGEGATLLEPVDLSHRIALSGRLASDEAVPLSQAPVEISLAPVVKWSIENASVQQAIANLQFPTDTTGPDGDFLVWLDSNIGGAPAVYEIETAPPASAGAPRWTFEDVGVEASATSGSVELGELVLPPASYARGTVVDSSGAPVAGAELRLYQLPSDDFCEEAKLRAAPCEPVAKLRGIWESGDAGDVMAILPRIP